MLITAAPASTHNPISTAVQETVVAAILLWFGPRGVRRSIAASNELDAQAIGSGEPTPLWHIGAIVIGLTLTAGTIAGWDAGLRVTIGCALVGSVQMGVLALMVKADEHATGRTYYRVKGSRILRGTRLGYVTGP